MSNGGKVEEEDDFISIRCNPIDSNEWEIFESIPQSKKQPIELQLPTYCGIYFIAYVRTTLNEDGSRTHIDLSEPLQISISFPINNYCPEESITFIRKTYKVQKKVVPKVVVGLAR